MHQADALVPMRTDGPSAGHLAGVIRQKFGIRDIVINFVGPVIGAHSGPGTVALFFLGTQR